MERMADQMMLRVTDSGQQTDSQYLSLSAVDYSKSRRIP
jgi:hypothetical protein